MKERQLLEHEQQQVLSFTCVTSTKVQRLTPEEHQRLQQRQEEEQARAKEEGERARAGAQITCFTSASVSVLLY